MFQISYYDDCSKLHTVNVESSTPEEAKAKVTRLTGSQKIKSVLITNGKVTLSENK